MDSVTRRPYSVLTESDVRLLMEKDTAGIAEVLCISESAATVLLARHGWSPCRVFDDRVLDDDALFERAGISRRDSDKVDQSSVICDFDSPCGICFESFPCEGGLITSTHFCGHSFCKSCWGRYIHSCTENLGSDCFKLNCPHPTCSAAVGPDMVEELKISDEDLVKYTKSLISSYVLHKKEIKWCPAPSCSHAVLFPNFDGSDGLCKDVTCDCTHSFCWSCLMESHRPITCNNARDWIKQATDDEAQSVKWMVAHTKPCLNCDRRISRVEEELACSRMKCVKPCEFEFCWNCLGSWKGHNFKACHDESDPREKNREICRIRVSTSITGLVERHVDCHEKWALNHSLMQKAAEKLNHIERQRSSTMRSLPTDTFEALRERLILHCRRILKWSYAFSYYLPPCERAKEEYLKHLQHNAEAALETYVEKLDQERKRLEAGNVYKLNDLCLELFRTAEGIESHFNRFVEALEKGLPEVKPVSYTDEAGPYWYCDRCSFANYWIDMRCEMCSDGY